MDRIQSFQEFLTTQSVQIPAWGFVVNIIIAALLAYILSRIYVRYGRSLSNRVQFAGNFILLAMTTMLIISIVKSSLALSLGLVGALSIVRFRAAIKEPEELAYLFFCIAIGLGLGADQAIITIIAFILIIGSVVIKNHSKTVHSRSDYYLTIRCSQKGEEGLKGIVDVLKRNCSAVNIRRVDETDEMLEVTFIVEFNDYSQLERSSKELRNINHSANITFMDNKGIS